MHTLGAMTFSLLALALQPAWADAVDDSIDKIHKYTDVLNSDAAKYESLYLPQAQTLVKWRLGWEEMADLTDAIYYLDVIQVGLDRLDGRIEYLERARLLGGSLDTIESKAILAAASGDRLRLALLVAQLPPVMVSKCGGPWLQDIASRVPLQTILYKVGPDIGTFPLVQAHPSLAISVVLSENGDVSMSPDPYTRDQVSTAQGKWQIPGIASTVSAAIYLTFNAGAYTPATAIAAFVYIVSVDLINRYETAQQADAVNDLVKAMDRIQRAQESVYLKVSNDFATEVNEVCEASFGPSIVRSQGQLSLYAARLVSLAARLDAVTGYTPPVGTDPLATWDALECEIFACDGPSLGLTKTTDQLADGIIEKMRSGSPH